MAKSISPEIAKANSEMLAFCSNPNWTDKEISMIKDNDIPSEIIPAWVKILYPKEKDQKFVVKFTAKVQEAIKRHGSLNKYAKMIGLKAA